MDKVTIGGVNEVPGELDTYTACHLEPTHGGPSWLGCSGHSEPRVPRGALIIEVGKRLFGQGSTMQAGQRDYTTPSHGGSWVISTCSKPHALWEFFR